MKTRDLGSVEARLLEEKFIYELVDAGFTQMTEQQGNISRCLYLWSVIAGAKEDLDFIADQGNLSMHQATKVMLEKTIADLEPKFALLEPLVDEYLKTTDLLSRS